jgi:nucleotide-binding universal stress UspA family protein
LRGQIGVLLVGAQGRGTLAGRVLGSTSYKLVQRALQPVVVVPPGWLVPRSTAAEAS